MKFHIITEDGKTTWLAFGKNIYQKLDLELAFIGLIGFRTAEISALYYESQKKKKQR